MRKIIFSICFLGALIAQLGAATDFSGNWIAQIQSIGEPQYARVAIQASGDKLTGSWGEWKLTGSSAANGVEISLTDSRGQTVGTLTGAGSGSEIAGKGNMTLSRRSQGNAEKQVVAWKLSRPAQPQAGGPKTWDFAPTAFYAYYSAKNPPALRVFPGDTVRTWTVDAGGLSSKLERLAPGSDSTIGPFYVENTLPGDTLVVKLNRLRPNRDSARQGSRINPRAVTPAFAVAAQYEPGFNSEWKLDREKGIATLAHPTDRLRRFAVPILPMLGCVAVAPAGEESFRGTDLGPFGGNLDYNQNGEGTTLYFPVFHPGGLFVLGDGHAAMGDGELTGSALETSMDVEFTVNVIPGYATPQVRAETSDYLVSFGVAGSVPDAIQIATAQLADWLKRDYRLNDNEVAVVLGTILKYEITELVDPKFDVVAKVPKSALAALK